MDNLVSKAIFIKRNKFFHCYYIEGLHDILYSNKKNLIETFNSQHEEQKVKGFVNTPLPYDNFFLKLDDLFYTLTKRFYSIDKNRSIIHGISVYYQTNTQYTSVLHNHHKDSCTMVMTTYIDPPNQGEGGELKIYNPPDIEDKIICHPDMIYAFPSWLLHAPQPQTNPIPRICLNWTLSSRLKPIHKFTGDIW